MAIFRKKEKKNETTMNAETISPKEKKADDSKLVGLGATVNSIVLIKPRVTEKATGLSAKNVYIFEVSKSTAKTQVKKAIYDLYKVNPIKIASVKIPEKRFFVKGKSGKRGPGKKVYVYLKEGDKIEVI
ncbi:MAG TPA: 50S ribosomal protein L23 [Candidatus Paceibacterota bacterium]